MTKTAGVLLLIAAVSTAGCAAGGGSGNSARTKANVAGTTVPKVIDAGKAVFQELGISQAGAGIAPVSAVYGLLVGKAGSGSRVQVIANKRGAEVEIIVTTDGPADAMLEGKVLAAVKARLP